MISDQSGPDLQRHQRDRAVRRHGGLRPGGQADGAHHQTVSHRGHDMFPRAGQSYEWHAARRPRGIYINI